MTISTACIVYAQGVWCFLTAQALEAVGFLQCQQPTQTRIRHFGEFQVCTLCKELPNYSEK